jgi:hypothetical protein
MSAWLAYREGAAVCVGPLWGQWPLLRWDGTEMLRVCGCDMRDGTHLEEGMRWWWNVVRDDALNPTLIRPKAESTAARKVEVG